MFFIIIFLFSFPSIVHSAISFTKLPLPSTTMGPEAFAFDPAGAGPYTGVSDGRILKYQGPTAGFTDFAFTSPNRSKALCDGTSNPALGPICGRPFGLGFNNLTGKLYIADAYYGLLVVGKNGGLATQLATTAGFPNGLDVDPVAGVVYFTDASDVFPRRNSTGRFLKYDLKTKQVSVLLNGLQQPAGVAVSKDGTSALVTEFIGNRIRKYFLTGPRANTSQVIIRFAGRPGNIKRTTLGDFWVAFNKQIQIKPILTKPFGVRIDANGRVLEKVPLSAQYKFISISEVQEFNRSLYIGSMYANFTGVLKF